MKIYIKHNELLPLNSIRSEHETSINWYRDDKYAIMCTSDPTMVTKMMKAVEKDPANYRCYYLTTNLDKETQTVGNYFFEFPKNLLSYRTKSDSDKRNRELTDEERKAIAARFRKNKNNS